MSVAGLRYGAGQANGYAETKSGSFIYHGDAASYHDWEFRTLLRVELLEAQEAALRKAATERRVETPSKETVEEDEIPTTDAPPRTPPRPGTSTTESRFFKDPEVEISKERYTLVAKIMEGLRGNAFPVARDTGTAALVQGEGLRSLISKIKLSVFPRASEEAKELFRLGQMRGGVLSRQMNESMVSYVDRRRRWWRMTSELDPTTQISESMRSELMIFMIELSGISHQESLVVKSISGLPLTFKKVAETLISHYGSVHLRGSKTLTSATSSASAMHKGGKGKGNGKPGKTYWRTGFYGDYDEDGEWFPEYSQPSEYEYPDEYYEEGQFAGLFANEPHEEEQQPDYPEEEVEEWEATVLNAVSQIGESTEGLDMSSVGEALQLELAALTAYGKSKGKKGKGKGKGKGKLVKSNLTLQQRRDKLQEIKAKSRCLRCGGIGHWAGDPSCKFPGSKQASQPSQSNPNTRSAMMAIHSESSSSDGEAVNLGAGHPDAHIAMMAYATQSKAKAKAKAGPILPVREERALAARAAKASSSSGYRGEVAIAPLPKPKSKSAPKRTPPNPPLAKCAECRNFSFRGSTAYTTKKTYVVCGNSETTRTEENYIYTFENCPHEEVDHRGSSKSTSRVFCKQCGNFIHEEDIAVRKHRLEVSKRVEEVPEPVLEVASHVTDPRSSEYKYPNEEVLNLLCQNLSDQGDLTVADLHGELAQAIDMHNALMDQDHLGMDSDDPDGYPGWDPVPNAYMAVSTDQATGVVMLNLPVRDIMDPDDPNIYAALDEGCNSTCHSSKWGEMCNQKLKRFGVEFKMDGIQFQSVLRWDW